LKQNRLSYIKSFKLLAGFVNIIKIFVNLSKVFQNLINVFIYIGVVWTEIRNYIFSCLSNKFINYIYTFEAFDNEIVAVVF